MGQGQEILARRYLQHTIQLGGWLLLQNAHLGLEYLEEFHQSKSSNIYIIRVLCLILDLITTDTFDSSFRVYVFL